MYLSNFQSLTPTYIIEQQSGLDWLSEAHAKASGGEIPAEKFSKLLQRYGCGPDKIAQRGTYLRDFSHRNWDDMQIFGRATTIDDRMAFYKEALLQPIEKLYADTAPDFQNFIHVSCTGYVSPSLAQTLVSTKNWGQQVECLHAYHMGCYAAFPALRMARGNLNCEILHTELCTLHLNPANHDPEQLVIQSLFADGVIRYRATAERPTRGFQVVAQKEVIAAGSLQHMTWDVSAGGFKMTLARDVPKFVQAGVQDLVRSWQSPQAVYAIHPGGPRIIDAVREALSLSEEQVHFSREILRKHGNMSSATLPHVWAEMLHQIPNGTPVISMAFGPGLTLSASQMIKVERHA